MLSAHDQSLRDLRSMVDSDLASFQARLEFASLLTQCMDQVEAGAATVTCQALHPDSPARLTVAAAVALWRLKETERRQSLAMFAELHDPMSELKHLQPERIPCRDKADSRWPNHFEDSPFAIHFSSMAGSIPLP